MLHLCSVVISALAYSAAFLYPSFCAGGLVVCVVVLASLSMSTWQLISWWSIFYGCMHYPVYLFCAREWGLLVGVLLYGMSIAYAAGSAALVMYIPTRITAHRAINYAIGILGVWCWQEYGPIPNPFVNPLVPLCAWLPYSAVLVYTQWSGWLLLLSAALLSARRWIYGLVLMIIIGLMSLLVPRAIEYSHNCVMPVVDKPCKDIQQIHSIFEQCFSHKAYDKKIVIFPESFFKGRLEAEHILIKSIKDYASYEPLIVLGAARQSSINNPLHNSMFLISKQGIEEYFDKVNCLYGAERGRILPGTSQRRILKTLGWMPYLCSELFWARSLDSPSICLAHDAWPETAWMADLMLLKARLLAVQNKTVIIYCSYAYRAIINQHIIQFL